MKKHACDAEIRASEWAMSGYRKTGDQWRCSCGRVFIHDCDEAEGCAWWYSERMTKMRGRR